VRRLERGDDAFCTAEQLEALESLGVGRRYILGALGVTL
jgi:hypothetical protein